MDEDQVQCIKEAMDFMRESIKVGQNWSDILGLSVRQILRAYIESEQGMHWADHPNIAWMIDRNRRKSDQGGV